MLFTRCLFVYNDGCWLLCLPGCYLDFLSGFERSFFGEKETMKQLICPLVVVACLWLAPALGVEDLKVTSINGGWSPWSLVTTSCLKEIDGVLQEVTCGGGKTIKRRSCTLPAPQVKTSVLTGLLSAPKGRLKFRIEALLEKTLMRKICCHKNRLQILLAQMCNMWAIL